MASDKKFVEFVVNQIENAGVITYRNMFGEYGIFADGKIFALICNNQLFIKPTALGRAFIQNVTEAPPYAGAKPSFLIKEKLDDPDWLNELVRITIKELPEPKTKRKKKNSNF